jgi:hypothetical protein
LILMRPSRTRFDLAIADMVERGSSRSSVVVDSLPVAPELLAGPRLPAALLDPADAVARPIPPGLVPMEKLYAVRGMALVSLAVAAASVTITQRIGYLAVGAVFFAVWARIRLRRDTIENAARRHAAALAVYHAAVQPRLTALERHRESVERAQRLLHALPELYRQERDSGRADRIAELDLKYVERRAALERQVRESGAAARRAAVQAWTTHDRLLPRLHETAAAVEKEVRRASRKRRRRDASV